MYKIGITASAFDLLHAGHISMLEQAKSKCTYLIAAIQTDPSIDRPNKNKPIQSIVERVIQLRAVRFVDEIIPYTTEADLENLLKLLPIDIRIIGEEYKQKDFTGKLYCIQNGIEIFYNPRTHNFSSSELR